MNELTELELEVCKEFLQFLKDEVEEERSCGDKEDLIANWMERLGYYD